jgi:hypothetical protein
VGCKTFAQTPLSNTEARLTLPDSIHIPHASIESGDYVAEVLRGSNTAEPFWYYVLQRKDSPEILDLAKYNTFQEALEGANQAVAKMHSAASGAQ